jgi:ribonuclease E
MEFREEAQEVTEVASLEFQSTPPPSPEPQPKSPAVSLWHKIFGSPAEQTAKLPEPAPSEPAWNDDLRSESPSPVFDETFGTPSEELAGGEFDDMSNRGERTTDEEEGGPDDRKRGRSRRRRRGGRGRRSSERRGERSSAPLQQESEGIDDLGVELDSDDDSDVADLSGGPLDDEDGDGNVAEVGGGRGSAAQRAIPSWDDAIGFIVDSNMQSRSQRRPAPRSGNGPRGRSRGRRKT